MAIERERGEGQQGGQQNADDGECGQDKNYTHTLLDKGHGEKEGGVKE